jgi:hypothetical protein
VQPRSAQHACDGVHSTILTGEFDGSTEEDAALCRLSRRSAPGTPVELLKRLDLALVSNGKGPLERAGLLFGRHSGARARQQRANPEPRSERMNISGFRVCTPAGFAD